MRKTLIALCAFLLPLGLQAQDLTYYLPRTTVVVEVDAVQDYHFAGPYAAFAKRLLGIDVPQQDLVSVRITEIRLTPVLEADLDSSFTVQPLKDGENPLLALSPQGLVALDPGSKPENLTWRFSTPLREDFFAEGVTSGQKAQSYYTYRNVIGEDSLFTQTPVQQTRMVGKTLEEKAAEAAEIILTARKERVNIATGNTDASFSGEALGAALNELTRAEKEYMRLFAGAHRSVPVSARFELTPRPSVRGQRYPVFVLSETDGPVAGGPGTVYYIQLADVRTPASAKSKDGNKFSRKQSVLYYREPAVCTVRLLEGERELLETRIPVYQLGVTRTMPLK